MAGDEPIVVSVGVSHHTAPVAVRERMALDEAGVRAELAHLLSSGMAREAMIVSTCNRVELYAVVAPGGAGRLRAHLEAVRGEPVGKHLVWRQGVEAVQHLFRVAGSLDSLVIGEPQILGQVKEAVRMASEAQALGPVLHRLAQRSLWVAKHIRTHTELGRSIVGAGSAGVALAQRVFSSLAGRRAMLVGTGEMGRQVARAMVGAGVAELLVANRTLAAAVELAEEHGGTPISLDRVEDYLARVDVVIVATAAAHPVIEARHVQAALRERRGRPLFLVDLSVPRNVDPEVDRLEAAYLFNVDDLASVVADGHAARAVATVQAEAICRTQAEAFGRRLGGLAVHDGIGRLVRRVDALRQAEITRSHKLWSSLSPEQQAGVEALLRAFEKKVLHGPIEALRQATDDGDDGTVTALLAAWDVDAEADSGQ